MTTRGIGLLCFLAAVLALSALPTIAADEPDVQADVRIVRLSLAQGDVQIDRNAGVGWEQAINNMPLVSGTRIYAAENSRAEIELEDGSSIRLAGPAQIVLDQLSLSPDGAPVNDIEIDSGLVYIKAELTAHADFRFHDASGDSFAITEPSHLRFKVDEQVASLAVMDGEVEALDVTGYSLIRGGGSYNYILGQPESAARLDTVAPESEDGWDQQRDQYENQYAPSGAQYSGGESSEAYGAADLGYYGSYEDIPGYGESWQPAGVGPGWEPFDNGAWCYYPDWGWTFVSGYPWGWEPFFFGDWFFVSGRGWWWHSGPHRRLHHGPSRPGGWHAMPRVANGAGAGHGFSTPHPPSGPAHRTVAIAGSNLRVGPIGVTHASLPGSSGLAGASGAGVVTRPGAVSNLARPGAASSSARPGAPPARPAAMSNLARPGAAVPDSITGRRGSYTFHGPAHGPGAGGNGYELQRTPASGLSAPHTYSHTAPRPYVNRGRVYTGGSASSLVPRTFSAPPAMIPRSMSTAPAPTPHSMSAPPASMPHAMSAPAASSSPHFGSGASSGGFHGGAGFSGGGGTSGGGFRGGSFGGHR